MTSKLTIAKVGGGVIDLTGFSPSLRKGAAFFDHNDPLIQLGMRCANGEASQGTFRLMDPEAELPRTDFEYNLPAHKLITWSEDASGTEVWLHRGRTSTYDGGRGDVLVDNEVEYEVTSDDGNIELRGQAFVEAWVRPEETDTERLYALQEYTLNGASSTAPKFRATCAVTVDDTHLAPDANTVTMPAKTYPVGTQPQDVIQDCADTASKIYGVVIHHTGGSHLCLLYTLEEDYSYTTAVRISDHVDEWDPDDLTAPVFEPHWEQGKASLYDGQQLLSGLVSVYAADQAVFVEHTSNVTDYDYWVDSYSDSQSETAAQATLRASGVLSYRRLTHVTHRVSIVMLPEQVHLLHAGMAIDVKAAAMMGGQYLDTWQTRRIAECQFEPRADGRYWAHLNLDRAQKRMAYSPGKITVPKPPSTSTATGAAFATGGPPPSLTAVEIAIGPGTDQCLYCFIEYNPSGGGGGGDIVSVIWKPGPSGAEDQAMTFVGGVTNAGSTTSAMAVYRLLNPSPSAGPNTNIGVTIDGAYSETGLGAIVVDHVDQSNPDNTIGTAYGSTSSSSVSVTQPAQGIVINGAGWVDTTTGAVPPAPTPAAGQTAIDTSEANGTSGTGDAVIGIGYGDASPGWTFGASKPWCAIAVPVNRTQGTGGVSIGGPGEGSVGTPGTYIPGGTVIEHGDLSGKGGTMHDATQVSITDAGGYYTGTEVEAALQEIGADLATGTGAPTTADYLVGTASGDLSAEIVVGTTPGGELGGTWASPTVDATHSGSAHTDFIAKAIVDAKGDLIAGTAADTVGRLAVGTNGQRLVADSSQTTGLAWADATDVTEADVRDAGRWEPVTNGDVGSPEIVFEAGDVVMEWVTGP